MQSQDITTAAAGAANVRSEATTRLTRAMLAAGIVAGQLFIVASLVQVLTRQGFDLTRQPISMLSLGDLGWIQIANFEVTGLLVLACAVAMRRARDLPPGPVPRLPAGGPGGHARNELACRPPHRRLQRGVPLADRRLLRVRSPVRGHRPAGMGSLLRGHRRGSRPAHRPERGPGRVRRTALRDGGDHLGMGGSAAGAAPGDGALTGIAMSGRGRGRATGWPRPHPSPGAVPIASAPVVAGSSNPAADLADVPSGVGTRNPDCWWRHRRGWTIVNPGILPFALDAGCFCPVCTAAAATPRGEPDPRPCLRRSDLARIWGSQDRRVLHNGSAG